MSGAAYRLSELGWLQFERLTELVVRPVDAGQTLAWVGRADRGRMALVAPRQQITIGALGLSGPAAVVVLWSRDSDGPSGSASWIITRLVRLMELAPQPSVRVVVVSNLDEAEVRQALASPDWTGATVRVIGARALGKLLDADPAIRLALPSVLGVRDLPGLIAEDVADRSDFDLAAAQALAQVFWSTAAYERASDVLARHRFVVLTGPPEMGKTAIAQMLGLALMTDGWEVHECSSPEALWSTYEPRHRQVFIADDAFGSTEYRPDAAERWAQALGRVLGRLDGDHVLIWTSRPAPLKAGLSRIQRERGAERFPSPGQVLVDASQLDLSEKTLILFRHAKARRAEVRARTLIRSWGPTIVEHTHFTPERIRRLITDRIDEMSELALADSGTDVQIDRLMQHALATPTEAMRTSYRTLSDDHRELLIALLDAPAGMIDERELAATLRRHSPGGLSRPLHESVERLTDHFLRVGSLGIGWVHPSWRDLVIDELRDDPKAREAFLACAGVHGVMLALSRSGGSAGERELPLLVSDRDWDRLGDRFHHLAFTLEDRDLARLLLTLRETLTHALEPEPRAEAEALAAQLLDTVAQRSDTDRLALSGFLVEAWYSLNATVLGPAAPPSLVWTWAELHPGSVGERGLDRDALNRLEEWLILVETLARHDPSALRRLGFFAVDQRLFPAIIASIARNTDPDMGPLIEAILERIQRLVPRHGDAADLALLKGELRKSDWWTPEDITAPPTQELVQRTPSVFTRADVVRVLADLD